MRSSVKASCRTNPWTSSCRSSRGRSSRSRAVAVLLGSVFFETRPGFRLARAARSGAGAFVYDLFRSLIESSNTSSPRPVKRWLETRVQRDAAERADRNGMLLRTAAFIWATESSVDNASRRVAEPEAGAGAVWWARVLHARSEPPALGSTAGSALRPCRPCLHGMTTSSRFFWPRLPFFPHRCHRLINSPTIAPPEQCHRIQRPHDSLPCRADDDPPRLDSQACGEAPLRHVKVD